MLMVWGAGCSSSAASRLNPSNLMLRSAGRTPLSARIITWGATHRHGVCGSLPASAVMRLLGAAEWASFPARQHHLLRRHRGKILGLQFILPPHATMITARLGWSKAWTAPGLHGWQVAVHRQSAPHGILLTWPVLRYKPDGPQQVKVDGPAVRKTGCWNGKRPRTLRRLMATCWHALKDGG